MKHVIKHFRATVQHMPESDILAMIDPADMARIKAQDPTPTIRVYGIGHEGTVQGNLVGRGPTQVQYIRQAIQRMYSAVKTGTKAFVGHGKTNDHAGRQQVGEIVGKRLEERDGGLFNTVAVWMLGANKNQDLDIASIEAEVEMEKSENGDIRVVSVADVTALALGSSKREQPGFPGATLLGAMQAFVAKGNNMTLEEIKAAIKEGGYSPSALYSKAELKVDAVVRDLNFEHSDKEFEHRKKVEKQLDEQKTAMEAAQAAVEALKGLGTIKPADIPGILQENSRLKATTTFESIAAERKLTPAQKSFMEKRLPERFTPVADGDKPIKDQLTAHVDAELKEFDEYAKMLGVPLGGGDHSKGTPAGDASPGSSLADPKNNDFIPQ